MGGRGDLEEREVVEQAVLPSEFSATAKMPWEVSWAETEIPRMLE